MAFRGFGDDALKVKADKREAALKAAQIAASERASMRSANVQIAGLQENARQADMANQRAGEQLAAGNERFDKQLAAGEAARMDELGLKRAGMELQASELALKREGMVADESYRRDALTLNEQMRKADLGVKMEELSQRERQIQLNEGTYAKLNEEDQRQRAAQAQLQDRKKATLLAAMRAAAVSEGPLGYAYPNAINDANGVAWGDEGSCVGITPIPDPKTGEVYGIGFITIKDGKPMYEVKDPMIEFDAIVGSMKPESALEWADQVFNRQKGPKNTRATVAAKLALEKHGIQFGKTDPGTLLKAVSEKADELSAAKPGKAGKALDPANQADLDNATAIQSNVLKTLKEQTSGEPAEVAGAQLSPEQRELTNPLPPGKRDSTSTAGTGATINKEAGTVTVKIGGQTKTVPDSPALRDWLKKNKISVQ